jgi:tetratricopeptide (TPR) repeat protein
VGKRDKRLYDNQGRDQINIEQADKVLLQSQEIVRSSEEEELLEEVRKRVEARLAGQLHHAVRLNLQKELQPKQVRPWSMEVKVAIEQPHQLLSPDTTIEQVFDRCSGRLLILGEPGAGKTTSLLDLTLELVTRAEADSQARVPVIVDLSDWQPTPPQTNSVWSKITIRFPWDARKGSETEILPVWSIADWFVVKVQEKYGFPPKQIEQWLADRRLIPLLDGLDEVRPEYQQDCVRAIKQWLKSDLRPREVAICCRREQYEAYSEKIELDAGGAVYLQDLTDEQIQIFLNDANRGELWTSLAADDSLLELIRRPLLLSMAVLAYEEIDRIHWQQASSAGECINLLLDAYVRRMLTQDTPSRAYRKGKIPSFEQSQKWLEILALQLLQDSETDFLIEKMHTGWLATPAQTGAYLLLYGIVVGLLFGSLGILHSSIVAGVSIFATIGSLLFVWTEYRLLKYPNSVDPPDAIRISLPHILSPGLLCDVWNSYHWLIVISSLTVILLNTKSSLMYIFLLLIISISFLLIFLMVLSFPTVKLKKSNFPNHGVCNSIQNTFLTILALIPVLLALFYLLALLSVGKILPLQVFLPVMLPQILITSLFLGFLMRDNSIWINHCIIRLILFSNNLIPVNYVRFLNYSTERLLLHRVGGRYRFAHDLLRQFLAQRRINKHPELISSKTFARCGEAYYLAGQYDKALENFDRAIEIDPKYSFAIMNRGSTYRAIERYNDSLQDFTTLIELNGKNDEAFASRGETYRLMKQYDNALEDFNRAIEIDPKYSFAIVSRGETYEALEQYNDALQDFSLAIKLDPENTIAILYRATICMAIQKYDEAVQDFTIFIKLNDKNAEIFAMRGVAYQLMKRHENALKDFNHAIEIKPKYSFAIVHRGKTYQALEQCDNALQDFSFAIKLDSGNTDAILCRARIYRATQKYNDSLQDFTTLIKLSDKDAEALAGRGETYRLMERYEEALKDFNLAVDLNSKYVFAIVSRGEVCQSLGKYKEALNDFDLAIELEPKCDYAIQCRQGVSQMINLSE